ncbi:TPA: carbon-nitrogen hydrolase family protein, partial [Enterobacter hormaechei subsp. oharae]|nr:carbon-nitrogen hydrolase family protein [Enterobacter hormaechei subsp. oharae]HCR0530434.1 carbon-nitrogen hydrolase family protein [Enterobacter hormaechei]HCR0970208.1 carbon-nitrogen hydrolase family protein [Enterobacter hormaechei]
MSRWNIAAAQYAPRHNCVDEHVKHHLHFIAEAAGHGCDLIVFPELSLTGPVGTT